MPDAPPHMGCPRPHMPDSHHRRGEAAPDSLRALPYTDSGDASPLHTRPHPSYAPPRYDVLASRYDVLASRYDVLASR